MPKEKTDYEQKYYDAIYEIKKLKDQINTLEETLKIINDPKANLIAYIINSCKKRK